MSAAPCYAASSSSSGSSESSSSGASSTSSPGTSSRRAPSSPRLPERRRSSRLSAGPPRGPAPPQPPPPSGPQQAQERILAGALAFSGFLGTLAAGTALLSPGVELWGHFDASRLPDLALALQLCLPCTLLNVLILGPNYSSWRLPEPAPEPTAQARTHQDGAEPGPAAEPVPPAAAPVASSSSADPPRPAQAMCVSGDARSPAAPTALQAASEEAPAAASSSGSDASSSSSDASSSSSSSGPSGLSGPEPVMPWPAMVPADASLPPWLARLKDAVFLAQGHYLSANPAVMLPLHQAVVVMCVQCLTEELLYRSVALQVAGGWLSDRLLEAGAEDWLVASLPSPFATPHLAGQVAAVGLLSLAWGVAVVQSVVASQRRPVLAMGAQGQPAAARLLHNVSKAAQARQQQQQQEEAHQQRQQQQQQQPSAQQAQGREQDLPGHASSSAAAPCEQQQLTPSSSATEGAGAGAGGSSSSSTSSSSGSSSSRPGPQQTPPQKRAHPAQQPGWGRRVPGTLSALALSRVVQGARDLSQAVGLSLSFVLTGNLAAPVVAAVANQALMGVLQRRGMERARQRRIAVAKHIASLTRSWREMQRKRQDGPAAVQQLGAGPGADASEASSSAAAPLAAAVPAAAAPGRLPNPERQPGAEHGAPPLPLGGSGSRVEATIEALDALLGEEAAEHAPAK